ncbi:MAG: MarR family transcriptional regulator [Bacteroidota bacterium]
MKEQDLEDLILFQIDRANKMAKIYSQRKMDKAGIDITVDQWVLLKIIEKWEELSQRELAEHSKRDPASITRTLHILQQKGFVNREPLPDNRRQYSVKLSQAGKAFVKKNMALVTSLRQKSINGFSDEELHQLRDMLVRIQENMSEGD